MKKMLSLFLAFILVTSVFLAMPITVSAIESNLTPTAYTSGDYKYNVLSDGTAEITDYTGSETELIIPTSLDGYKVTSLGNNAFYECSNFTSIIIPESVTNIGYSAFYECSSLIEIIIPDSVTNISDNAFCGCSSLISIIVDIKNKNYDSRDNCNAIIETESNTLIMGCMNTVIPSSVTSIGDYAFYNCSNLNSIIIPDNVTIIGNGAFYGCSNLTSIMIPEGVTNIDAYTFRYCSSLSSIKVDSNNQYYDSRDNCNAIIETESNTLIMGCLNTVIPRSVVSIGNYAFAFCYSLESIIIPEGVTNIGLRAFHWCSNLTTIIIPRSMTYIGYEAFYNCSNLTTINIPNSVINIDDYAFAYCKNLTTITIPSSMIRIGGYTFYSCSNLTDVYYESAQSRWNAISIGNGNKNLTNATIHYNTGKPYEPSDDYNVQVLSDRTVEITNYKGSATTLTVPLLLYGYKVSSIGGFAFSGRDSLVSIIIPEGINSIGGRAFENCDSLTSITIPSSVTSIDYDAINDCKSLDSIKIDGNNQYYDSRDNCNAIIKTSSNTLVAGCRNTVIPSSVSIIGACAFASCEELTSITIPSGVTSIGASAFIWCSNLTAISIPESVTSVGANAFYSCDNLESITIYSKECSIGSNSIPLTTKIYCLEGSTAHDFAENNGYEYELISVEQAMMGDVDGDDTVTIMDATMVQRHIAQLTTIPEDRLPYADTDRDTRISIMDATQIQRFIAQLIPSL